MSLVRGYGEHAAGAEEHAVDSRVGDGQRLARGPRPVAGKCGRPEHRIDTGVQSASAPTTKTLPFSSRATPTAELNCPSASPRLHEHPSAVNSWIRSTSAT